jgi:hypothetical protein
MGQANEDRSAYLPVVLGRIPGRSCRASRKPALRHDGGNVSEATCTRGADRKDLGLEMPSRCSDENVVGLAPTLRHQ